MKSKLLLQTKKFARLLVITGLGICATTASAQVGTAISIDPAGTPSNSVFKDWNSFWRSLQGLSRTDGGTTVTPNGSGNYVTAATTVTVKASMTEVNTITFPQIAGMSSTNTITIDGGGFSVTYAGTAGLPEVMSFTGGDYFTVNKLTVINSGTATNIWGVRLSGNSDYNTFSGCNFQMSALTTGSISSSGAFFGIAGTNLLTSLTSGQVASGNGYYNTVNSCVMSTTNVNSPGPAYGIFEVQSISSYSSTPSNNTYSNNTIQNFFYAGINTYYTNGTQMTNNDISRANNTATNPSATSYGIYSWYTYATNRSVVLDKNNIHDLPYKNATPAASNGTTFAMNASWIYGTTTNKFSISGNTINLIKGATVSEGIYTTYLQNGSFASNTITSMECNGSGNMFGIYSPYSNDINITKNVVKNCLPFAGFYGIYSFRNSGTNTMNDNQVDNNQSTSTSAYHNMYGLYTYDSKWDIQRNLVRKLRQVTTAGYVYGAYLYYATDVMFASNLVDDLGGAYGTYSLQFYQPSTSYKLQIRQNTFNFTSQGGGYFYHYYYCLYGGNYGNLTINGNIFNTVGSGTYGYYHYLYGSTTAPLDVNNNTIWLQGTPGYQYWSCMSGGGNDFSTWATSGYVGSGERYQNPNFRNASGGDFRSDNWVDQNNVPTNAGVPTDYTGAARNPIKSDRGAVESFMDVQQVSNTFTIGANACQGATTGVATVVVKNLYSYDTAWDYSSKTSFNVSMIVNGIKVSTVAVNKKTLVFNDTAQVKFPSVTLNTLGANKIRFYIDIPDDNVTNDSSVFTTFIKPAPGGQKLAFGTQTTKALYQYGKANDVTIVGQPVYYSFNSPKGINSYTNAEYGTKWTASSYAITSKNRSVPFADGVDTLFPPSGSTDLLVKFLPKTNLLEDTMIRVAIKISDLTNGCDTLIYRNVLVYPSIIAKFGLPAKICNGDAVGFTQLSKVQSGSIAFLWDFGTGNPLDQTDAPEPVFQFPSAGTYNVKMRASTLPYGFVFWDSATVVVNSIPTVKFSKVNACETKAVTFTNQTTPASAYVWSFGDATANVTTTNASHIYAPGSYLATLTASLNGCSSSNTQRVYEFDKPFPDWKLVSGNCDNDMFMFDDLSTIKNGLVGSFWNFNDGNVSTEEEPSHMFTSPGDKSVKLVATSEFGCKDSLTKTVKVKESPKAAFFAGAACSITPTNFTNETLPVSGTVPNYAWDFGDGTPISPVESPTHPWTNLGPKTVKFTVTLNNGCSSSAMKDVSVGVQPTAKFAANNVCSGLPVVFENNTTWAQGDISYSWNFGDGTNSTNSDPLHAYTNVTATTTYFVTLYATIAGGCKDSLIKSVTVNEGPKTCDFNYFTDYANGYYGVKFNSLDASGANLVQDPAVTYTWVVKGNGTVTGPNALYNFQQNGSYEVTMRAKVKATGCECTKTKMVTMTRQDGLAVKDLAESGMALYPNPTSGSFNIALTESFGKNVTVEIMSMTGAVVKTISANNNGLVLINAAELSNGVYMVRVSSADKVVVRNIQIQK